MSRNHEGNRDNFLKRSFEFSVKHLENGGAGSYYFVANLVNSHDQIADQSVSFALQHLVKSPLNMMMTGTVSREQQMHRELGMQSCSRSYVSV